MTNANGSWVKSLRADALSKVILTRRKDIRVSRTDLDSGVGGVDLIATIDIGLSPNNPEFGVENIVRSASSRSTLSRIALSKVKSVPRTLPVCLFFLDIDAEIGHFLWLVEPIVDNRGVSRLISIDEHAGESMSPQFDLVELNNDGLSELVERVVTWFQSEQREQHRKDASRIAS